MLNTTARRGSPFAMPLSSLVMPGIAVLGGLGFFAWKPGVAVSAVASIRALGFLAGVGIVALGLGWALPRLGRGVALTALAQAVPLILAFVVTVLPSFRSITVNDPLPATGTVAAAGAAAPGTAAAPGSVDAPATIAVVGRANLAGINHRASGSAALLRLADGSAVVRLERLDVEPGPDYFVFVVPGADRHSPDGGTRLHRLRGSRGNQNYPVAPGVNLTRPLTVLIWCRAFSVPVAAATLT